MDPVSEVSPIIRFLEEFRKELHNSDKQFLPEQSDEFYEDEIESLKLRTLVPLSDTNPLITVFGPKIDRGNTPEQTQIFGNRVCARTISTYPQRTLGDLGGRDGDPVCDRYGFYQFANRSIVVVADGCNWGERPKRAAERARNSVMGYLKEKNPKIKTINDAKLYLLRSFNDAHNRICEKHHIEEEIGSTTLLAGISLEIEGENGKPNEWAFVCTSVGDCKAFLIHPKAKKVVDITMNNRSDSKNATDCGGRLGPVMPDGGPDLRNLATFCCRVEPGDLIMVMSDGVHDNFHPSSLHITPKDLKIGNYETWDEASKSISVEEYACRFRVKFLERLLEGKEYSPLQILNTAIKHSEDSTFPSRDFMETKPGKCLPKDYKLYPGKMDHTTCVIFSVGATDFQSPVSPLLSSSLSSDHSIDKGLCIPISVTMSKDTTHLTIYCRTIAKGKFECTAKKTECILTVTPRKPFESNDDEKICGIDELSLIATRVVKIPQQISIDVQSKEIFYDTNLGIITIRFTLL